MDLEDLEPRKVQKHELGAKLDNHSVADLKALVEALKQEIARVEAEMAKKVASRAAANSVFKS
ncbi:MAG: DUF1192 domain-containing protein [Pseudomonadota bacterium]|nr:DUF1192 domain-containing protein [Pseudomonadota bacterium]